MQLGLDDGTTDGELRRVVRAALDGDDDQLPAATVERLVVAVERVADATERVVDLLVDLAKLLRLRPVGPDPARPFDGY